MKAFEKFHPFVLLVYFLAVLLVAMFVWNPILQLIALLGGALFCCMLQGGRAFLKSCGFYALLFCLIAVTNPLFSKSGVTPLFYLLDTPFTKEALCYGVVMACAVVAVLLWCSAYSRVLSSEKFLYLFGKPVPKLALVLSTALRFVPLFTRQMRKVSRAQKAMGLYASGRYIDRVRSLMHVLVGLLAWAMENAMDTAASMQARGYGLRGRTNFSLFHFQLRDGILLSASVAAVAVILYGVGSQAVHYVFYPRLGALPCTPTAVICYTAYGLFTFLPFILEVREAAQWKYYSLKM